MRRRCRHKRTTHRYWRDGGWCGVVHGVNCADWIGTNDGAVVCKDCGAWLSLGPSDETDPRVAVEIRAAEIANHQYADSFERLLGFLGMTLGEAYGWDSRNPAELTDHQAAGYLARCITHPEGE